METSVRHYADMVCIVNASKRLGKVMQTGIFAKIYMYMGKSARHSADRIACVIYAYK